MRRSVAVGCSALLALCALPAAAQPVMELAASSLDFAAVSTEPPPAAKGVQVNNTGTDSLAWTAAVREPAPDWISLSGAGGVAGESFSVSVDHTGLPAGIHTAHVDVTAPDAANSPQEVAISLLVRDQDADVAKANSYDDAWEDPDPEAGTEGWVIKARALRKYWALDGKTEGFVVHIGDSITWATAYGHWGRFGEGKTAADAAICSWMHANVWGDGTNNSVDGWYLAAFRVPNRVGGFTSRSGIRADQFLTGGTGLPTCDEMFTEGYTNPDGKQYRDAQIAIVMLATNDVHQNRPTTLIATDLEAIVSRIEAAGVIVVLSTIPPKNNDMLDVHNINAVIRQIAQTRQLPMIDYCEEIQRRRPGTAWLNTLISEDGIHPSVSAGDYPSSSVDPYQNNAEPLSWVGYLLRGWLSVQKVAEIKAKVIDAPDQLVGDADWDGEVSVLDIVDVVTRFGAVPGHPQWSPSCDFDLDREISVLDITAAAAHFGATQ